jgi:hypothetical protein
MSSEQKSESSNAERILSKIRKNTRNVETLFYIWGSPEQRVIQSDLCKGTGMPPPTTTRIVKNLIKMGLIAYYHSYQGKYHDQRSSVLTLTDLGSRVGNIYGINYLDRLCRGMPRLLSSADPYAKEIIRDFILTAYVEILQRDEYFKKIPKPIIKVALEREFDDLISRVGKKVEEIYS